MSARTSTLSQANAPDFGSATSPRGAELIREHERVIHVQGDRMFRVLLLAQWAAAIGIALTLSPYGWAGKVHSIHQHVQVAILFGAAINFLPLLLIQLRPGWWGTRQAVAVAQMLWSALFIHLTGGRIETHFHVFVSLAFLAFYRDWKMLPTATAVVVADHLIRGILWPESVYGIVNPEWWRFLEHAGWVVFEDTVLIFACLRGTSEIRSIAQRQLALEELITDVERKVVERTRELESSREQLRALVETAAVVPWEFDRESDRFNYVGPQIVSLLGFSAGEWAQPGFAAAHVHAEDLQRVRTTYRALASTGEKCELEYRMLAASGQTLSVREVVTATAGLDGRPVLRGLMFDVTESRRLEQELSQAQKLESVGRLAAGIAHEINTPVQFVSDSVHFVRGAVKDLTPLLENYGFLHDAVVAHAPTGALATRVQQAREDADVEYVLENVPKALERSLEGLERVASIVRAMKDFAHPDQREMTSVDLNRSIQSTLVVARHEYKLVAEVVTEFATLPAVTCHSGDVNQAVLNIVVNAAHAIGDVVQDSGRMGLIRVTTRSDGEDVVVSISDTGGGIPAAVADRIFDPFFTTKGVGKGTGQGLAIARSIIQEKHCGTLTFESEPGKGTTFHIRLPIRGTREALPRAA